MHAVATNIPDVPSDTADPAFEFGDGLRYENWAPVPAPTDAEKATTTIERPPGSRYDLSRASVGLLLDDPDAAAIINEYLPELTAHPLIAASRGMQVIFALEMVAVDLHPDPDRLATLKAGLSAL